MKEQTDKWAKECLKENEDLKDSLKRTVCQAECFRYKEAEKYKAENEYIKEYYNSISDSFMKLRNEEWNCYYLASTIKSIFEGARGATEQALKQITLEKVMYYVRIADRYLHFHEDTIKREIKEKNNKYKQALEEIKEIVKLHQYFNPEILEIKGNIGQIQDLKMTEIYKKCKEVLEDK